MSNVCFYCMHEMPSGQSCPVCGHGNADTAARQPKYALPCGTVLQGRYVVGRVLGQGGFGITYMGYDAVLQSRICIKEYYPAGSAVRDGSTGSFVTWSLGIRPEFSQAGKQSFVSEARKAVKLRDLPSVVKVWDVFYENETAYIVMEFIEGMTLKEHLAAKGAPMTLQECCEALEPVMKDLQAVHDLGIIHRDISPDNLMRRRSGELVLLDLGAAKDMTAQHADASMLVARKGFSPAEQYVQGGQIGPWTDVYALAATIYYCMTGHAPTTPVERSSGMELNTQGMPQALADFFRQGLALQPRDRFQSVNVMRTALERVLGRAAVLAAPIAPAAAPARVATVAPAPAVPRPAPPAKPKDTYIILQKNDTDLLQDGMPLVVEKLLLLQSRLTKRITASLRLNSFADGAVRAIIIDIACTDEWGKPLTSLEGYGLRDLNIIRGAAFETTKPIPIPDGNTRRIALRIRKVLFSDGAVLESAGEARPLPAWVPLEERFDRDELEYIRRQAPAARFLPQQGKGWWRCACGEMNGAEDACRRCASKREKLMELTDGEYVRARLAEIREQRQKARRKIRRIVVTAVSVAAALALGFVSVKYIYPYVTYVQAERLLQAHDYDGAYKRFLRLGDYEDSAKRATIVLYEKGRYLMEQGDYAGAASAFEQIPDHRDSKEKAVACRQEDGYLKAVELLNGKEYEKARDAFLALGAYKDSADLADEAYYRKAADLLEEGKFDEARDWYLKVPKYKDSGDMALECVYRKAESYLKDKAYDEAYETFRSIKTYKDAETRAKESKYLHGAALFDAGEFEKAAEAFNAVRGYKDARNRANEALYCLASALFDSEEYDRAAAVFRDIAGYKDAASRGDEAIYLKAEAFYAAGRYADAANAFKTIKTYRDGLARYQDAYYLYGQELLSQKKYKEAAAVFKALKPYLDSETKYQESYYTYGELLVSEGKYKEAAAVFKELDKYRDSQLRYQENYYAYAEAMLAKGSYVEAANAYKALGNYKDSGTKQVEAYYLFGESLMSAKKYKEAAAAYKSAGSYKDSQTKYKEAYYQYGLTLIQEKKYTSAVSVFEELGSYKESKTKLNEARYAYVTNHKNNTDTTTYEYLKILKKANYKDSAAIYKDLYAWKITNIVFNSSSDEKTNKTSISKYSALYCHFKLTGGTPGGTLRITAKYTLPNGNRGSHRFTGDPWESGSTGWYGFTKGIYSDPKNGKTGTFTVQFFDEEGNLIGQASVQITY